MVICSEARTVLEALSSTEWWFCFTVLLNTFKKLLENIFCSFGVPLFPSRLLKVTKITHIHMCIHTHKFFCQNPNQ